MHTAAASVELVCADDSEFNPREGHAKMVAQSTSLTVELSLKPGVDGFWAEVSGQVINVSKVPKKGLNVIDS